MPKTINRPEVNRKLCEGCSTCCEYVNILLKEPKTRKAIDKIVWFLLHEISVRIDTEGDWMAYIPNRCKALDAHGRCKAYLERPTICREYSQSRCEKYSKMKLDRHIFENEGQFIEFILADPKYRAIYERKAKRTRCSGHCE